MGRKRIHVGAAERQKAYRERLRPQETEDHPVSKTGARRQSRPARLVALIEATEVLQGEYAVWLDSLPETLEATAQYERLQETVEQFATVVELFNEIDPPRGYGRD